MSKLSSKWGISEQGVQRKKDCTLQRYLALAGATFPVFCISHFVMLYG